MILAEGFQYRQGLLTGDLYEADICHKYHQERWSLIFFAEYGR